MNVTRFTLRRKISSCLVTRDLLSQLEHYILVDLSKIIKVPKQKLAETYQISITDKIGEESIDSIIKYIPSLFPDSTLRIKIQLRNYRDRQFFLSINFHKDKFLADIEIEHEGNNAREVVFGVYEKINGIIKMNKTINWAFNFGIGTETFLFLFCWASGFSLLLNILDSDVKYTILWLMVFILCVSYFIISRWLKPYISFDSRNYYNKEKWFSFFIKALLAYIIFSSAFTFLRKIILGF